MRIKSSYNLAHAAGEDAGNRAMRKAGRTAWNHADYEVATKECNRLTDIVELESAIRRWPVKWPPPDSITFA